MILSDKNIEKINFFYSLINKGRYASIEDITNTYNEVFRDRPNFKEVKPTNCGSCLKSRVCEMYGEMELILNKMVQNNNSCLNVVSEE